MNCTPFKKYYWTTFVGVACTRNFTTTASAFTCSLQSAFDCCAPLALLYSERHPNSTLSSALGDLVYFSTQEIFFVAFVIQFGGGLYTLTHIHRSHFGSAPTLPANSSKAATWRGASFQLLPGRPHRRDLLRGERLEGLGDEVRVGADHLLPAGRLHDVSHVVRVDEVDGGRLGWKRGLP